MYILVLTETFGYNNYVSWLVKNSLVIVFTLATQVYFFACSTSCLLCISIIPCSSIIHMSLVMQHKLFAMYQHHPLLQLIT